MTNNRKITLATAICSTVVVLVLLVVMIINFKRMKQSIQGTIGKSYFTIDELCASDTAKRKGIDNTPTPEIKAKLQALIDNVLDPARREYGSYILVNSGYRSPALNAAVGGVSNSQHLTGEAADITTGSIGNDRKLFAIIVQQGNYDQLIWEKPKNSLWVHVSYSTTGLQRRQILAYNGKTYTNITNNWQTYIA